MGGGMGSPTSMYGGGGYGGGMMGGGMGGYGSSMLGGGGMMNGGMGGMNTMGGNAMGSNDPFGNGAQQQQLGPDGRPLATPPIPTANERKKQRRMFILGAVLQMFSLLVNVLMQTLRGAQELAAIGFGTWFAIRTIRDLMSRPAGQSQGQGMMMGRNGMMLNQMGVGGMMNNSMRGNGAMMQPPPPAAAVFAPTSAQQVLGVTTATSSSPTSTVGGKLSMLALTAALYFAAQYGMNAIAGGNGGGGASSAGVMDGGRRGRKRGHRRNGGPVDADDDTDDELSDESSTEAGDPQRSLLHNNTTRRRMSGLSDSSFTSCDSVDEEFSDGEQSALREQMRRCRDRRARQLREQQEQREGINGTNATIGQGAGPLGTGSGLNGRQVYVAEYDFSSTHDGRPVQFRTGDQFIIDDFRADAWCVGTRLGASSDGRIDQERFQLPGNYMKALPLQQKF